jgi:hypothetical protein
MKFYLDDSLHDYIDEFHQDIRLGRNSAVRCRKAHLGKLLAELESEGDAMRYLDTKGRVAWKATPRLRSYLDDRRANAEEDKEWEAM